MEYGVVTEESFARHFYVNYCVAVGRQAGRQAFSYVLSYVVCNECVGMCDVKETNIFSSSFFWMKQQGIFMRKLAKLIFRALKVKLRISHVMSSFNRGSIFKYSQIRNKMKIVFHFKYVHKNDFNQLAWRKEGYVNEKSVCQICCISAWNLVFLKSSEQKIWFLKSHIFGVQSYICDFILFIKRCSPSSE